MSQAQVLTRIPKQLPGGLYVCPGCGHIIASLNNACVTGKP